MSFYYDGISTDEISGLYNRGVLRGITTNLTLINNEKKKQNVTRSEILRPIVNLAVQFDVPVSIQLESDSISEMISEGEALFKEFIDAKKLYIKVPVDFGKLQVINKLSSLGIKVNATCVTSFSQAQMACEAGASIVSFFWGKMSDQGLDPFNHVSKFRDWKNSSGYHSVLILVGSIRQTSSISSAFEAGANVVTTSYLNWNNYSDQLLSSVANKIFQDTN